MNEQLNLPPEISNNPELEKVFTWFNETVTRLEGAYQNLVGRFEEVSTELESKNNLLNEKIEENTLIQDKLDGLLHSMKPGVLMVDPDLNITVFNKSAENMLQMKSADLIGRNVKDSFPLNSGIVRAIIRAYENNHDVAEEEKTVDFNGLNFPATFKGSAVIDSRENLISLVVTFSDLSSLKRMEEEVQQAKTLTALGELAATVAHEIRNPLGAIGGYAGLLARDVAEDEAKKRLVDKIILGVSSLNKIVSSLLVYTRKSSLHLVSLDICEWMEDVLAYAEIEIEKDGKNIVIQRNFPKDPVEVELDPEKFQQVMLNLLFNAIQAIEDDGVLEVYIKKRDPGAVVFLRDNGAGMEVEVLKEVFIPFYTTKEQGTGLGLAIVKKIVEAHGGTIFADSEFGKGTEFLIELKK
ncbi:MAG: ATP-binding protein [Fibrobacterales bacterium]